LIVRQPKRSCYVRQTAFTTTPAEAKDASSVQPIGCDFSEGEAMAHTRFTTGTATRQQITAAPYAGRIRRRRSNRRLVLVLIAFAIVLLALGGWAVQALRLAR
jgi:hypothetical protein